MFCKSCLVLHFTIHVQFHQNVIKGRGIIKAPDQVKDLFKVQNRPMNSDVKEHKKFTDTASGSSLLLTFKKLPLPECLYTIKERNPQLSENAITILFLCQPHTCVRLDFLQILQPNNIQQQIECRSRYKNQAAFKPDTKKSCKKCEGCHFYYYTFCLEIVISCNNIYVNV